MKIQVRIFKSTNEVIIGTLCTHESGESCLHYNYATIQDEVDYDEYNDEVNEIAENAQEYCANEGYNLTSY